MRQFAFSLSSLTIGAPICLQSRQPVLQPINRHALPVCEAEINPKLLPPPKTPSHTSHHHLPTHSLPPPARNSRLYAPLNHSCQFHNGIPARLRRSPLPQRQNLPLPLRRPPLRNHDPAPLAPQAQDRQLHHPPSCSRAHAPVILR